MHKLKIVALTSLCAITGAACSSDKSDADFQSDVKNGMHDSISTNLASIVTGAMALQAAAPTHAWDATADATAIAAMQTAWKTTRVGYESVEGATAPIFPQFDVSMDARYDDFMMMLAPNGDADLFDDVGVTGMHAIERILYAPQIRQEVIDAESGLSGYVAASFPTTDAEAMEFKTKLCQKLIDDAQMLHDQWVPSVIDPSEAFQGLVGLMNEQQEKVTLAAAGDEESRYANITLFDLRNNLAGTKTIYEIFQPWILSKPNGSDPDTKIEAGFAQLNTLYSNTSGDAIPPVPADWMASAPTPGNLATPFGMLYTAIHTDADLTAPGSVDFEMNAAATLLGLMTFTDN